MTVAVKPLGERTTRSACWPVSGLILPVKLSKPFRQRKWATHLESPIEVQQKNILIISLLLDDGGCSRPDRRCPCRRQPSSGVRERGPWRTRECLSGRRKRRPFDRLGMGRDQSWIQGKNRGPRSA